MQKQFLKVLLNENRTAYLLHHLYIICQWNKLRTSMGRRWKNILPLTNTGIFKVCLQAKCKLKQPCPFALHSSHVGLNHLQENKINE